MEEYLYKYFVIYSKLAIPDIGQFTMEVTPASVDDSGRLLLAPAPRISFVEGQVTADKHFFDFIAAEMNVDEVDAIRRFRDYAVSLKQKAVEEGVTLTGIGQLHHSAGRLVFSAATPEHILPAVSLPDGVAALEKKQAVIATETSSTTEYSPAETPVNEEIVEEEVAEERSGSWWIYAVILLLAGISAILFYYA
ncbi:hypothetical protein [Sediminibacterium ginsengisoli]|uniref:CCDC81-like prokaryotic HU domain-containing protein n=1 Tax=Sediminibacterium ginsengisoli TaxID=413434 RepID=A0A1T4PLG7_9BACT|nr:hypothetical protein [Sediminibacterium ginsengisoli]SJZ92413.1 hypothetical protein SAMN04488132_10675 [Sediminibacterium ginsengisoli]